MVKSWILLKCLVSLALTERSRLLALIGKRFNLNPSHAQSETKGVNSLIIIYMSEQVSPVNYLVS